MNTLNVSLFIKRAEEYQTKEFIINIFHKKNIGQVKDVKFIKKQNHTGKSYNGVIVTFDKWYNNNLLNEINSAQNGTFKFNFNNSYWFINVHKEEFIHLPDVIPDVNLPDVNLPDKDRIKQLEDLVKSMSSQINYLKERSERTMMDYEHTHTQQHLYNIELRAQLDDKDTERSWIEHDFKEDIDTLKTENKLLSAHLERKYYECEGLREELKEQTCMLAYTENQVESMKHIINLIDDDLPIKKVINTYIKEYCF
jgi:hypothetical protein